MAPVAFVRSWIGSWWMRLALSRLLGADPSRVLLGIVTAVALVLAPATAVRNVITGHALDHDDARSHLLVARRVLDNSKPGLDQLGGVWLPLPHLLNALPVAADPLYRTGASAVVISLGGHVLALSSLIALVLTMTRSHRAAVLAAAVFGLNANLLYLAGTPMTEPLCAGLLIAGLAELARISTPSMGGRPHLAGLAFAGACLTRYEAWTATAAACLLTLTVLWDESVGLRRAWRVVVKVAVWPAAAIALFALHSYSSTGEWLVTSGFFPPDNTAAHDQPLRAADQLFAALCNLVPWPLVVTGLVGSLIAAARSLTQSSSPAKVSRLALALWAAACPAMMAFVQGHPVHVRFASLLVPAVAVGAAIAVSWLPRRLALVSTAALSLMLVPMGLDATSSAIAREARRGGAQRAADREALDCLAAHVKREDVILASLGAVAPEVQRLGGAGVTVRQVVHEGLGREWWRTLASPVSHVNWILMADVSTDPVAARAQSDPSFLAGFREACDRGERLRVFRRVDQPATASR